MRRRTPRPADVTIEVRRRLAAQALACYPGGLGHRLTKKGWTSAGTVDPFWAPECPPEGCDLAHLVDCPRRALAHLLRA